jgi:hypothetical protein
MTTYGITVDGFNPETTDIIRTALEQDLRYEFSTSMILGDQDPLGHLVGLLSAALGDLWAIAEVSFSMMDVDKAAGAMLRALCLLTGTTAKGATSSVAAEILCGDDGTLVPSGSIVWVGSTSAPFETMGDAALVLLDDWAATTTYAALDRVTNAGNCYQCITGGISAGSGGPVTTTADETDGTAHWTWIGTGTAIADVVCASSVTGPIFAAARDLTAIQTPVGGWNTAINLKDAVLGADQMTDKSLRLLREKDLARSGTGTPPALEQAALDVTGVTAATVFMNVSNVTDGDGLPPKSVNLLIQGGDDQEIWQMLWDNVPLGIVTIGAQVGFVTDRQGRTQTLRFDRPTLVPIYMDLHIDVDPLVVPSDGVAQIKQAIATYGAGLPAGTDAVSRRLGAQAFKLEIGVTDVPLCAIGTAPSPTLETTIAVDLRHLATYDTSNMSIEVTEVTP